MIASIVYNRLQSTVAPLVGGTGGAFSAAFSEAFDNGTPGRIFPIRAVTNNEELPAITYSVTSEAPSFYLDLSHGPTRYSVQVDAHAIDYDEAEELAAAVKDSLHLWREGEVLLSRLTTQMDVVEDQHHHRQLDFTVTTEDYA